ncbi:hypothetical protein ACTFIY_005964 [Dictyostelium cf. discoideum]
MRGSIDSRFSFNSDVPPPNHSNQLVPVTTSNQIVVHTPQVTKSTIDSMRKNKTQGGLITYQFDERKGKKSKSQQNNHLTLVQNNIQINNNNLVQLSTPTSPPTLLESNSTIQKSSTHSSSCAMPSLDEKLSFLGFFKKKVK